MMIENRRPVAALPGEAEMGVRYEEVRSRMDGFIREWPGSDFGPAHIVLSDDNLDNESIDYVLGLLPGIGFVRDRYGPGDLPSEAECAATEAFLRSLKEIPAADRCPDDDGLDLDDDPPRASVGRRGFVASLDPLTIQLIAGDLVLAEKAKGSSPWCTIGYHGFFRDGLWYPDW